MAPSQSARTVLTPKHYSLPLSFEENQGQSDSAVKFIARENGTLVAFGNREVDFVLTRRPSKAHARTEPWASRIRQRPALVDFLRMRLVGGDRSASITGIEPLAGIVNYFIGNDPAKWRRRIPTFGRIRYSRVYSGTDLDFYSANQHLEFDFKLAPGSDPRDVGLHFAGARRLFIDLQGNLRIFIPDGSVRFQKPVIYQVAADGSKRPVPGGFILTADKTVRFRVGPYDHSRPLVIDPILNYSTYFGGASMVTAVAVDGAGEAVVAGTGIDLPATTGSFLGQSPSKIPTVFPGYVAEFNSTGTSVIYCTYLGGSSTSSPAGIALDSHGDAIVAGATDSVDYPTTQGAFQTTNKAGASNGPSVFVTKLNSSGTSLLYSTFVGGSTGSWAVGIALDSSGNAYVTGVTEDTDFPITSGAFQQAGRASEPGFVSKLNPSGSALIYSTYLGGSIGAAPASITVDSSGAAYVGGFTLSSDYPTTAGSFQTTYDGIFDGFLTKLNPAGSGLAYSTYLGGSSRNQINGVAVDQWGEAYVVGETQSRDFPTTAGAFQTGFKGGEYEKAFVTKFNSSGSAPVYSSLLGGSIDGYGGAYDVGTAIVLDSQGDAIIAGNTDALDYPVTAGAFETQNRSWIYSGVVGSFLAKFNPTGSALLYSTYLSGSGDTSGENCDCALAVAIDKADNIYVGGATPSVDFPTTLGVIQTPFVWPDDKAFITEFNGSEMTSLPTPSLQLTSSSNPVQWGDPVTFTATLQSTAGATPTGTVAFSFEQIEESDGMGSGYGPGPWTLVTLDNSGTAMFTTSKIGPGTPNVTAYYLGDAKNAPITNSLAQSVTPIPTTTTLASSQNPALYGAPVTFTATVLDDTGRPAKGSVDFGMGDLVYDNAVALDANGHASWTNGTGGPPLPAGTDSVFAEFVAPVGGYGTSSTTYSETFTPLGTLSAPTFSPAAGTYTSIQRIDLQDENASSNIYYTTDGTNPTATNSMLYSEENPVGVSSSETIKAIAAAPGYVTSTVASAAYIIAPSPIFSLSGTSVTVAPGATTGNTSTITITPINGFTGAITMSAAITSGPVGGIDTPVASFGSTNPVNISSTGSGTATLTIATRAPSTGKLIEPPRPTDHMLAKGGAVLACCLILGMTRRCRRWQRLFGRFLVLMVLTNGLSSCGSGGGTGGGGTGGQNIPGTTPGTYIITVTGVSGILQESTTITLIVS